MRIVFAHVSYSPPPPLFSSFPPSHPHPTPLSNFRSRKGLVQSEEPDHASPPTRTCVTPTNKKNQLSNNDAATSSASFLHLGIRILFFIFNIIQRIPSSFRSSISTIHYIQYPFIVFYILLFFFFFCKFIRLNLFIDWFFSFFNSSIIILRSFRREMRIGSFRKAKKWNKGDNFIN